MKSLYACIIRTSDDDILTEVQVANDWLDNVTKIQGALPDKEGWAVHMCSVAQTDEPTEEQMELAEEWIRRHLQ